MEIQVTRLCCCVNGVFLFDFLKNKMLVPVSFNNLVSKINLGKMYRL